MNFISDILCELVLGYVEIKIEVIWSSWHLFAQKIDVFMSCIHGVGFNAMLSIWIAKITDC